MTPPLLEVRDLSVGYGSVPVLSGVSLAVPAGSLIALIGSNGAGKSTLLRALSGLLRPSHGSVLWCGETISGCPPDSIVRRGLLHVAEGRRLFRNQSVADNLELGLWGTRLSKEAIVQRFERVYSLFPVLRERRQVRAGVLSGGQQQMLAVAQALMHEPKLLMLDEPSLGLAPVIIDQLFDAIVTLRQQGTTILLVEQMVERALQIADEAYVLGNGRVLGRGTPSELRRGDLLRQAYLGASSASVSRPSDVESVNQ